MNKLLEPHEAIEKYLEFLEKDVNKRESDIVRQRGELGRLYKIYNKVKVVNEFSPQLMLEIKEHINSLKNETTGEDLSSASKERKYQIHRKFIQWLIDNNKVDKDILDGIDSIVREERNSEFGIHVNENEFSYYIAGEKDQIMRLFFKFLYYTGQTVSKTLGIQWKDIKNLNTVSENESLFISINKAFTRKDGLVELAHGESPVTISVNGILKDEILKFKGELTEAIGEIKDNHFLFSYEGPMEKKFFRSSQRSHEYLRNRVGVPKLRTLDFRNSYIVNSLTEDSSAETFQTLKETLGYTNINTVFEIYNKLRP